MQKFPCTNNYTLLLRELYRPEQTAHFNENRREINLKKSLILILF